MTLPLRSTISRAQPIVYSLLAAELIFGAGAAAESYYEKWRERLLEKRGAARG